MGTRNDSDKIPALEAKKKSKAIIKLMEGKHADNALLCAGLKALANIQDEDSVNYITHYLGNENAAVRLAACKAAISINTEYTKTRVRHQLSVEQDPATKQAIQEAFNARSAR